MARRGWAGTARFARLKLGLFIICLPSSPKLTQMRRRPDGEGTVKAAKFAIGQVVKHREYSFRGVIYDVDPEFSNTEEWWQAIPEDIRPAKEQPYYHLLAENDEVTYEAYVSEQNLLVDESGLPISHPEVPLMFGELSDGHYQVVDHQSH